MKHLFQRAFLVAGIVGAGFTVVPARATMVLPLNLEELSNRAELIFVGECDRVEETLDDNNFPATIVTYRVLQSLKGETGGSITFKQYGVLQDKLDRPDGDRQTVAITPYLYGQVEHVVGEKAIVFLRGASDLGFSGVVGLGQGKFNIWTDAQGKEVAANLFENAFCFRRLRKGSPAALLKDKMMAREGTASGPCPCHDLIDAIKRLVVQGGGSS